MSVARRRAVPILIVVAMACAFVLGGTLLFGHTTEKATSVPRPAAVADVPLVLPRYGVMVDRMALLLPVSKHTSACCK